MNKDLVGRYLDLRREMGATLCGPWHPDLIDEVIAVVQEMTLADYFRAADLADLEEERCAGT